MGQPHATITPCNLETANYTGATGQMEGRWDHVEDRMILNHVSTTRFVLKQRLSHTWMWVCHQHIIQRPPLLLVLFSPYVLFFSLFSSCQFIITTICKVLAATCTSLCSSWFRPLTDTLWQPQGCLRLLFIPLSLSSCRLLSSFSSLGNSFSQTSYAQMFTFPLLFVYRRKRLVKLFWREKTALTAKMESFD